MRPEIANSPALASLHLSEEQRMNRICQLLSKAVVCDWSSRLVDERGSGVSPEASRFPPSESSDGERILGYLSLVRVANAALIRETLGLSKMRVYRALQPLLVSGRVTAKGHSRTTTYALSRAEADKIVFN